MIGFNGGLLGASRARTSGSTSIPGMWLPWENLEGRRNLTWAGSPLVLDLFLGSTAAYSLRNLRLAYATSPVVQVRRSTDSTERDFTADQVIDTTSNGMLAWVKETSATANGFVRTWYDQSGSNNHAEQTNTTIQPRIVNSGVLETDGVTPSILFGLDSGVNLLPPSVELGANCAFFSVTKNTNPTSNWSWFIGERNVGNTMIIGKRQGVSTLHVVGFGGGAGDVAGATISAASIGYWQQGTGISRYMINNTGGSLPGGTSAAGTAFRIGNRANNSNEVWVGYISEIIYFSTSQITRNASISFAMNKYYNYYVGVSATGGNTTEDKQINNVLYRVHTFTTVDTSSFILSTTGFVEYLVIAGGGGGGSGYQGGGGGAGGLLTGTLSITSGSYNITVGDGGVSNVNGGNSIFSSITAIGGGRGSSEFSGFGAAAAGGSGGGGGHGTGVYTGGAGTSGQGFAGGNGTVTNFSCGGGGGASGTGETADGDEGNGAAGGLGLALDFNGVITTYSTGGKGSRRGDNTTGVAGASNTGNGGGGSSSAVGSAFGAKGGSGIVIIRYPI